MSDITASEAEEVTKLCSGVSEQAGRGQSPALLWNNGPRHSGDGWSKAKDLEAYLLIFCNYFLKSNIAQM